MIPFITLDAITLIQSKRGMATNHRAVTGFITTPAGEYP
jgi:hypothetical protein